MEENFTLDQDILSHILAHITLPPMYNNGAVDAVFMRALTNSVKSHIGKELKSLYNLPVRSPENIYAATLIEQLYKGIDNIALFKTYIFTITSLAKRLGLPINISVLDLINHDSVTNRIIFSRFVKAVTANILRLLNTGVIKISIIGGINIYKLKVLPTLEYTITRELTAYHDGAAELTLHLLYMRQGYYKEKWTYVVPKILNISNTKINSISEIVQRCLLNVSTGSDFTIREV